MKLLTATSFLFFTLLFFLNSCSSDKNIENKKASNLLGLENKINQKLENDEYDSAIFVSQKLLKAALVKNKIEFIQKAYDNLSKSHGFLRKYDSAIFYTHKMLKVALENEEIESIKKGYDKLSRYLSSDKQYDLAIFYSEKLFEISKQTQDTSNMARANLKKGLYYEKIDSLKLSYINFVASKDLYLKVKDTINAGKRLLTIAYLQKKQGNFGASELSALDGLNYLENTTEYYSLSGLYHILSVVSKETGKTDMALKRIDEALELIKKPSVKKKDRNKNLVIFSNTKANIHKELKQYDVAIGIYENLLHNEEINPNRFETARINGNLAHTLFLRDGFNKRSDSLLKSSLSYYQEKKQISGLLSINIKLGELYNQFDKKISITYINRALKYAEKLDNPTSICEALEVKIKFDPKEVDVNRYIELVNDLKVKREDLSSLYANERYDLNRAENELIVAEKKTIQSRNFSLILLLIFIVVLVLIFFIYQKIKRRHRIEKVKTVHTTEARISSKVHDELANDVYKLMTQLETSKPDREMVLDKLDSIYNNARDISKQIQNVDTGKGFPDELNNLLRSYQSDDVNVLLKRYEIEIWKDISSHVKTTVYRVLQELLTNMKKHSNAVLVVVSIEKANKKLFIQYIDNGKGFSEEISKNGLQNAENRIHAIDGSLTFDTELQKGCKFSINVPV